MNRRTLHSAVAVATGLLLVAGAMPLTSCSSGDSGGKAALSIKFTPNPVLRSGDGKWYYKVYLSETKKIGVAILGYTVATYSPNGSFVNLEFFNDGDFDYLFDCDAIQSYLPGGLTACSDNVTVSGSTGYKIWTFQGKDDRGNAVQASARVDLK